MTTKTTAITITSAAVLTWKRENNSASGNPSFSFVVSDESGKVYSGKTRSNAGFVYGLSSYPDTLQDVVISTTPTGRVYMDAASQRQVKHRK
jgi:hypothetical protein